MKILEFEQDQGGSLIKEEKILITDRLYEP